MKIAFVGKGGSGKSTIAALFARYLASQRYLPLIIDADINQHIEFLLGFTSEGSHKRFLGHHGDLVKRFLRGSNPRFTPEEMIKTTPPGTGSRLITPTEQNELYDHFSREKDHIRFLSVGDTSEDDVGIRCYHSKTGVLELFLSHLVCGDSDYALVDMTAGADAFASGLFGAFDMTFMTLEPTIQSCSVWKQYKEKAKEYNIKVRAIGNKIISSEDVDFIEKQTGEKCISTIPFSSHIKEYEKGRTYELNDLDMHILEALEEMLSFTRNVEQDRRKRYELAMHFHKKNALSWGNQQIGKDITTQIDSHFDIEKAALKLLQQL